MASGGKKISMNAPKTEKKWTVDDIQRAVITVLTTEGVRTPDIGASSSTREVADVVKEVILS
jgi:isocitrate/isopropylmalate dehydrogenase